MAIKTFIFKNTTDANLSIDDLSGVRLPASGTVDVTEMFTNYVLYESADLKTVISGEQLVINDGTADLSAEDALIYCSYEIPIEDILGTNFNTEDGTYTMEIAGDVYVSVSKFDKLVDTPNTYSGCARHDVRVNSDASGLEFFNHQGEYPFGTQYEFVRSCDEESTTSEDWVHKCYVTLSGVDSTGEYRIGWSYEYKYETTNYQIETRVRVNDEFVLSDIANRAVNANDWFSNGGFHIMPGAMADVFVVELEYRTQKYNFAASIRRARMDIWRVK